MLGQLVEDVGGRGDGVRPEVERQAAQLGGSYQAPRQRRVAVDVRVGAGFQGRCLHYDPLGAQLRGLPVGVSGVERRPVGGDDQVLASELGLDPVQRRFDGAAVHPRQQAEGEEILGPVGVPGFDAELGTGLLGQRRHGNLDEPIAHQVLAFEGVVVKPGLGQVSLLEGVPIDDQRSAGNQGLEIRLQRRRVHGHQHVGGVARGGDVMVRDVDLKRRDPGHGAGWSPDLSRILRQRGQVVAEHGTGIGEPVARQLHAVARVAGEPDDDLVEGGCREGLRDVCHVASSTGRRCLPTDPNRGPSGRSRCNAPDRR